MKRTLISIAIAILISCTIHAASVNPQQAAQQARDFMSKNFSKSSHARRAAQTIPLSSVETGQSMVYAFNVEGGGYVIVAGDDSAPAILGYSETSAIDATDIPDGLKELFAQYQQEIQQMAALGHRAATYDNLGAKIDPLMASKWGQRAPYYYMCPKYVNKDDYTVYSLTGCVATAMTQIMYHHKHPAEITSLPGSYYNKSRRRMVPAINVSKTLEWDQILPTYGKRNDPQGTQEQQNAVAKLQRLAGQSICMKYTPTLSTANESAVMASLVNFFNYDASTIRSIQRVNYSYNDWIKTIYQELANNRPVYYSGASNGGGHAYVVDGYSHEDFFYINWGWYGNADGAFRLALCDPSSKYEGGGTGDAGYFGRQAALIGIQPAKTPQHMTPTLWIYNMLSGKYSYQRASANEDFDITDAIYQYVDNASRFTDEFDYGAIVKNAAGETVQSLLPLDEGFKGLFLKPGRNINYTSGTIKISSSLGDGTYTLQFLHRVTNTQDWKPFMPVFNIMFKIKGNTLSFDCCPDWLTAKMEVKEQETSNDQNPKYTVTVTLENKSTDKVFQRTLKLLREDEYMGMENYGFAALLGPGESKTYTLNYAPKRNVPVKLYLYSYEDCATLGDGIALAPGDAMEGVEFDGTCNLDNNLKLKTDKSYLLKADNSYEVVYTLKNKGTKEFKGYVELIDSVGTDDSDYDFEENRAEGNNITLKPNESKELKMVIYDEGDETVLHKISLVRYDNNDQIVNIYESKSFYIEPNYNLSVSGLNVTPIKAIDNELADYAIESNSIAVSCKINNPEETGFTGSVLLRRYVIDYSVDPETDEDGNDVLKPDKTYTKEVTIPAKGNIDFTQQIDLQNLVKDKKFSVVVELEFCYTRQSTTQVIPIHYSDPYMLNEGTSTGIETIDVSKIKGDSSTYYDLQGRRVSGRPTHGIYIKGNNKILIK